MVPNADGSITYVISVNDPGAANWAGPVEASLRGLFPDTLPWQKLSSTIDAGGAVKSAKLVKLADLPRLLGPVVNPAGASERSKQIADRLTSYAHRLEN